MVKSTEDGDLLSRNDELLNWITERMPLPLVMMFRVVECRRVSSIRSWAVDIAETLSPWKLLPRIFQNRKSPSKEAGGQTLRTSQDH